MITPTAYAWTMNASTLPLMAPGYVGGGAFFGQGGTDTSQNALYVDEVAIVPGVLSKYAIANLFYETKFYQNLLFAGLTANPPLVVFEGYGCGPDPSGDQSVAMTIGAAKAGLIHLVAMIDDDGGTNGYNSVGWFRQMLDQAGLRMCRWGSGRDRRQRTWVDVLRRRLRSTTRTHRRMRRRIRQLLLCFGRFMRSIRPHRFTS